jgi:hypothetical protein
MTAPKTIAYVMESSPSVGELDENDGLLDLEDAQSISESNIDPAKLATLLRIKFGPGTYDIHVSTTHRARFTNLLAKS